MNKFAESQAGEINALRLLCDHSLEKSTEAFGSRSFEANQPLVRNQPNRSLARLPIRGLCCARDCRCNRDLADPKPCEGMRSARNRRTFPSASFVRGYDADGGPARKKVAAAKRLVGTKARRSSCFSFPYMAPAMSICSGRCNHAIAEDQSHEIRFACGLIAGAIE